MCIRPISHVVLRYEVLLCSLKGRVGVSGQLFRACGRRRRGLKVPISLRYLRIVRERVYHHLHCLQLKTPSILFRAVLYPF